LHPFCAEPAPPEPVDQFERYVPEVSYEVLNLPTDGSDLYPPARVLDLLVINIDHIERKVDVRFTVTGDDLMQGTGRMWHSAYSKYINLGQASFSFVLSITFAPQVTFHTYSARSAHSWL